MNTVIARYEFLEAVIDGINTAVESHEENMRDDPLYGEADFYLWENVHDLKDLCINKHHDINTAVDEALEKCSRDVVLQALKNCGEIIVDDIYTPHNAVLSWGIGEQEIQLDELNDVLPEMTDYEKNYVAERVDGYWDPLKGHCTDCVYTDMSHEVIYVICDPELFKKELRKLTKN